jgi:hypothetical protein
MCQKGRTGRIIWGRGVITRASIFGDFSQPPREYYFIPFHLFLCSNRYEKWQKGILFYYFHIILTQITPKISKNK